MESLEEEISQIIANQETLVQNKSDLVEYKHILENEDHLFGLDWENVNLDSEQVLLSDMHDQDSFEFNISYITGSVEQSKFFGLERVLFRTTRGNIYIRRSDIDELTYDKKTNKEVRKTSFNIIFRGEKLHEKIVSICKTFGCTLYNIANSHQARKEALVDTEGQLEELNRVIDTSKERIWKILNNIAHDISKWKEMVLKEKALYHTLNMFKYEHGQATIYAEGWVPKKNIDDVREAISIGESLSGSKNETVIEFKETKENPPTYFKLNKFTASFQDLINAYGVPRYREINPTTFTIVTFPFMFGVMFGDIGHGFILLIASLFLLWKEKDWKNKQLHDLIQSPFDGRYILLLMSLFSIYAGFIYNEVFAVPTNIFGSNWEIAEGEHVYTMKNMNRTYEFGVDPVWKGAQNELSYYNSLKMKMSIIMAVIHMTTGLFLKLLNSIHFKNTLDIFFEVIPGITLLLSLFGYMCFLMFYKWSVPFYKNELKGISPNRGEAPQILPMMIYMFLSPYSDPPDMVPLFGGQGILQGILATIAVLCIPIMLLPKPLILRHKYKNKEVEEGEEPFEFSEVMVHQAIETIEFALGSISSTASYLRLWALSLAHSELATVFWSLGLVQLGLGVGNFVVTFVVFAVFCACTFGILMVMETLSAFLHSLRLHWVEFQGRFYKADGYLFEPFSYKRILRMEKMGTVQE